MQLKPAFLPPALLLLLLYSNHAQEPLHAW
jgi:hypothetical protein